MKRWFVRKLQAFGLWILNLEPQEIWDESDWKMHSQLMDLTKAREIFRRKRSNDERTYK